MTLILSITRELMIITLCWAGIRRISLAEEINPVSSQKDEKSNSTQACRELIAEAYLSQARWVILPLQDILGLGEEARMNVPGTINGNWRWQLDKNLVTEEIKFWLRTQAEKTKR